MGESNRVYVVVRELGFPLDELRLILKQATSFFISSHCTFIKSL